MELVSKQEAIDRGLKRYFTGKPCKHGHISERNVCTRSCLICTMETVARWRETPKGRSTVLAYVHSEKHKIRNREAYATPEVQEWHRKYRRSERGREVERQYRQSEKAQMTIARRESSERRKEQKRIANHRPAYRAWLKSPEGIACLRAGKARRRALHKAAIVPLTKEENTRVKKFYVEANRRTFETGIPHQVDHILPLARGGFHHPDNLQVVTQAYNCSKQDLTEEEFKLSVERGFRMRLDKKLSSA